MGKHLYEKVLAELREKDTFVGRSTYEEDFKGFLSRVEIDPFNVCVFYGVGGIGKTSLRKALSQQIAKENPDILQVHLDFYYQELCTLGGAMSFISNYLKKNRNIRFRAYEKAYSIYWDKRNSDLALNQKGGIPLLDETDYVGNIIKDLSDTMTAGTLPKAVGFLHKYINKAVDYFHNKDNDLLKELPKMEPREIEQLLPYFWAQDIREYLYNEGVKAVFFFDTFEQVQKQANHKLKRKSTLWIERLINLIPEVTFVIFGREPVEWKAEELRKSYANVKEFPVKELNETDTKHLLTISGVINSDIQHIIWSASKGLPYYIELAIDTYKRINRTRTPQPKDFSEVQDEVLARLIENLEPDEIETLKALSTVRAWDKDIFKVIKDTGHAIQSLKTITRFSFIQEQNGLWTMHQLMRDSLQQELLEEDEQLSCEIHYSVYQHYQEKLNNNISLDISEEYISDVAECFYHASHCITISKLVNWVREHTEVLSSYQWRDYLIFLYEELLNIIENSNDGLEDKVLQAQVLDFLGSMYSDIMKYKHAEVLLKKALEIKQNYREDMLQSKDYESGDYYQQLFLSYQSLSVVSNILGRQKQLEEYYTNALTILSGNDAYFIDNKDKIHFLNQLGIFYINYGKLEDAQHCLKLAIKAEEQFGGHRTRTMASLLKNLGTLYTEQGNSETAIHTLLKAHDIAKELKEHKDLMGWIHLALGKANSSKSKEAERFFQQSLSLLDDFFGADSDMVGKVLSEFGSYYLEIGEYEKAEFKYLKALDNITNTFSGDHPIVAAVLGNLGVCTHKKGVDSKLAEEYLKKSLEMSERLYLSDHVELAYGLFNLAAFYDDKQLCLSRAESYFTRALEISTATLRKEHPFTLKIKKHLGQHLFNKGKMDNGIKLFEEALAIEETIRCGNDLELANSYYTLGDFCNLNKMFTKAEDYFKKSIQLAEPHLPQNHHFIPMCNNSLALSYWAQGKMTRAENAFKYAIEQMELALGKENPNTLEIVKNQLDFYNKRKKTKEYNKLYYKWIQYFG
ncbi:tetratricopeptide repeat protein [Peribacillus butanolivorans]